MKLARFSNEKLNHTTIQSAVICGGGGDFLEIKVGQDRVVDRGLLLVKVDVFVHVFGVENSATYLADNIESVASFRSDPVDAFEVGDEVRAIEFTTKKSFLAVLDGTDAFVCFCELEKISKRRLVAGTSQTGEFLKSIFVLPFKVQL